MVAAVDTQLRFETFGNAIVQFQRGEEVLLTCDPWIEGTAYFGSWGIEAPLSDIQKSRVLRSKFIWISHGHPDHLHPESLALIPKDTARFLLPDHYGSDIRDYLVGLGFKVQVLRYREWTSLDADLKVLCLDNENQDAILVAKFGDLLLINQNDSPPFGEQYFLKRLVRSHPNDKTVLAALCAVDADMLNIVDEHGDSLAGPPSLRKKGAVWAVASYAATLGVKHFCCSSSQHVYLRPDSAWANRYRIGWEDMKEHWIRPAVALHEPYSTIEVEPLRFVANNPQKINTAAVPEGAPSEDWSKKLTEAEWSTVERFVAKLKLIKEKFDFIGFSVGGERRDYRLNDKSQGPRAPRGIVFSVPRAALVETMASGYFDDLLIGNFMKTQLVNATLYPYFTPRVAKLAGNAKVFTRQDYGRFLFRYLRRNPRAFANVRLASWWRNSAVVGIDSVASALGIRSLIKKFYRTILLRHPTS